MNRVSPWVIAGVVARVEIHLLEARHARTPQSFLARAGGRNRQTQHTNNRRGLYPAKVRRTSGNGLGRYSTLAIRWPCERQHGFLTGYHIRHLDNVPDSPDIWIGRAHLRIDNDPAARTYPEAGCLGQFGLGSHAYGEDDEIRWEAGTALRNHDQTAVRPLVDVGQPVTQMEVHPLCDEVLHEWDRYFRIEWWHDLRQLFQHSH